MRKYDCLFLLPGTFSDSEIPGILENVKSILAEFGAENPQFENLGRQKLAYPIKGGHFAHIVNSSFSLAPGKVSALKSKMILEPFVWRFLLSDYQAKEVIRRRPTQPMSDKTPAVSSKEPNKGVDLKAIDKKIEEILQQDNLVV
ncbi:MAG: 30S ribosomal protein S6 [Patescibacteria group bacterium]